MIPFRFLLILGMVSKTGRIVFSLPSKRILYIKFNNRKDITETWKLACVVKYVEKNILAPALVRQDDLQILLP